jgi:hypothetical protein
MKEGDPKPEQGLNPPGKHPVLNDLARMVWSFFSTLFSTPSTLHNPSAMFDFRSLPPHQPSNL